MFAFFQKKSSKKHQKPVKSANDLSEATSHSNSKLSNDSLVAKAQNNHKVSNGISPFGYFTTGRLDKKRSSKQPLGT